MSGLPRYLIKKYGVSKKAWAVFRGKKRGKHSKQKKHKTRGNYKMARRRSYKRSGKSKGFMGINFGTITKFLIGGALVAVYELKISQMLPFTGMIKNAIELIAGVVLAAMPGMPTMVRGFGAALATVNAFSLVVDFMSGGGSSSGSNF